MKLLNNFYDIIHLNKDNDGTISGAIRLTDRHTIYDGHFPGQPVVPGMCTLTIIRECLSSLLNKDIKFSNIKECKFITAVTPSAECILNMNFTLSAEGVLKGNITRADNNQIVLKIKATIN